MTYNKMAEADLDAIVAHLRTAPPVKNTVPRQQILPSQALPQLPVNKGIIAPDPANTEQRGIYLVNAVLGGFKVSLLLTTHMPKQPPLPGQSGVQL